MAGAHTWISESSALDGSEPRYKDGWHDGVRDVAGYLLRIADTVAITGRGRAASIAMCLPHSQQLDAPTPQDTPLEEPAPPPVLDAAAVLAAECFRGPSPRRRYATGRTGSSWASR